MLQSIKNIFHLGVKEIIELCRDTMMVCLIIYAFSLGIYVTAQGTPDAVENAMIAVVDEDHSQLSQRITDAFMPPIFKQPKIISLNEVDPYLDSGVFTFIVVIPSKFQYDLVSGKSPELQVNVDATRMSQAFVGVGYINQILNTEITKFVDKSGQHRDVATINIRNRFNPNLNPHWFGGINQMVNNITMLAILLIGAALLRERESGTLEHLLVMPVKPFEIMLAKLWSMMLIVLVATAGAIFLVLKIMLEVPMDGSITLYMVGVAFHLFAVLSMGITIACFAHNMPQMGMLLILVLVPMTNLSGGNTPYESMPQWLQYIMYLAPTSHFIAFSQQILFRGSGWDVVWKPFMSLIAIGTVLFIISLSKFRQTVTS